MTAAHSPSAQLATLADAAISDFFDSFAARLDDDVAFAPIARANEVDVAAAKSRGRSTTRLVLSPRMRADMVAGLRAWRDADGGRDALIDEIDHDGWRVERR